MSFNLKDDFEKLFRLLLVLVTATVAAQVFFFLCLSAAALIWAIKQ